MIEATDSNGEKTKFIVRDEAPSDSLNLVETRKNEDLTEIVFEKKEGDTETLVERANRLNERIVPPHPKTSRLVVNEDVPRLLEEVDVLYELCFLPSGRYGGAYAMHHAQIDDKDPLNFFVTANQRIVINPVITRHSNYTVDSKEACKSFNELEPVIVQRWHKIEVEYVTIMVDPEDETKFKLSSPVKEDLSGRESFIFQHEIGHGNAEYIYQY